MNLSIIKHTHHRLSNASHNMYAARVMENNQIVEYTDDDGDSSGSRHILKELRKFNVTNVIVVVSRWANKVHMGRRRFDIIAHCTNAVLQKGHISSPTTAGGRMMSPQSAYPPRSVTPMMMTSPQPEPHNRSQQWTPVRSPNPMPNCMNFPTPGNNKPEIFQVPNMV